MDGESELVGGIKNALERGEPIEKAKQSFINAGYTFEEVERASKESYNIQPIVSSKPKNPKEKVSTKDAKQKFSLFNKKKPIANKPQEVARKGTNFSVFGNPKVKPLPSINQPSNAKQKSNTIKNNVVIKPLSKTSTIKHLGKQKDLDYAPLHSHSKVNKLLVILLVIITSILVLLLGILATYWDQLFY